MTLTAYTVLGRCRVCGDEVRGGDPRVGNSLHRKCLDRPTLDEWKVSAGFLAEQLRVLLDKSELDVDEAKDALAALRLFNSVRERA